MGYYSDVGLVVVLKDRNDLEKSYLYTRCTLTCKEKDTFDHWTIYEVSLTPMILSIQGYCIMEYKNKLREVVRRLRRRASVSTVVYNS